VADVSEKIIASIFRVDKQGKQATTRSRRQASTTEELFIIIIIVVVLLKQW
jgi:hypothetical protein